MSGPIVMTVNRSDGELAAQQRVSQLEAELVAVRERTELAEARADASADALDDEELAHQATRARLTEVEQARDLALDAGRVTRRRLEAFDDRLDEHVFSELMEPLGDEPSDENGDPVVTASEKTTQLLAVAAQRLVAAFKRDPFAAERLAGLPEHDAAMVDLTVGDVRSLYDLMNQLVPFLPATTTETTPP